MQLYNKHGYSFCVSALGIYPPKLSDSHGNSTSFCIHINGKQFQASCKGWGTKQDKPTFAKVDGVWYRIAAKGKKTINGFVHECDSDNVYYTKNPVK